MMKLEVQNLERAPAFSPFRTAEIVFESGINALQQIWLTLMPCIRNASECIE